MGDLKKAIIDLDYPRIKVLISNIKAFNSLELQQLQEQNWILDAFKDNMVGKYESYCKEAMDICLSFEKDSMFEQLKYTQIALKFQESQPNSLPFRSMLNLSLDDHRQLVQVDIRVPEIFNQLCIKLSFQSRKISCSAPSPQKDLQVLQNAYQTKNQNFVKQALAKISIMNVQMRELVKCFQNSNLQEKDIKAVFTSSSLQSQFCASITPLEVGAFFGSRGIVDKLQDIELDGKQLDNVRQRIAFSAACNLKDDVDLFKFYLERVDYKQMNYQELATASFIALNKKVYAYLVQKHKVNLSFTPEQRSMLTAHHVGLLLQMGYCTATALSGMLDILPEAKVFEILQIAILDGNYKLYENDLLTQLLIRGNIQSSDLILTSGYSFQNSNFDYSAMRFFSDQIVHRLTQIIQKQLSQNVQACQVGFVDQLVCGLVQEGRLELLKAVFDTFFANLHLESQLNVVDLVNAWLTLNKKDDLTFQVLIDSLKSISDTLKISLITGVTVSQILLKFAKISQQLPAEIQQTLLTLSSGPYAILNGLYPSDYTHLLFARTICESITVFDCEIAPFLCSIARNIGDQNSPCHNQCQQDIMKTQGQILDLLFGQVQLFDMQVKGDMFLSDVLAENAYKFTVSQIDILIANYRPRHSEGAVCAPLPENQLAKLQSDIEEFYLVKSPQVQLQSTSSSTVSKTFTVRANFYLLEKIVKRSVELQLTSSDIFSIFNSIHLSQPSEAVKLANTLLQLKFTSYSIAVQGFARNSSQLLIALIQHLKTMLKTKFYDLMMENSHTDYLFFIVANQLQRDDVVIFLQLFSDAQLSILKALKSKGGKILFEELLQRSPSPVYELFLEGAINKNLDTCAHIVLRDGREVEQTASSRQWGVRQMPQSTQFSQKQVLEAVQKHTALAPAMLLLNAQGLSPVHYITSLPAFEFLVQQGVDLKRIDAGTSLFALMEHLDFEVVLFLADQGAELVQVSAPLHSFSSPSISTPFHPSTFSPPQPSLPPISRFLTTFNLTQITQLCDSNLITTLQLTQEILRIDSRGEMAKFKNFLCREFIFQDFQTAKLFATSLVNDWFFETDLVKLNEFAIKFGLFQHKNLFENVKQIVQFNPRTVTVCERANYALCDEDKLKLIQLVNIYGDQCYGLDKFVCKFTYFHAIQRVCIGILGDQKEVAGEQIEVLQASLGYYDCNMKALQYIINAFSFTTILQCLEVFSAFFKEQVTDEMLISAQIEGINVLEYVENRLIGKSGTQQFGKFVARLRAIMKCENAEKLVIRQPKVQKLQTPAFFAEVSPTIVKAANPVQFQNNFSHCQGLVVYNSVPLSLVFIRQISQSKVQYHQYRLEYGSVSSFKLSTYHDNLQIRDSLDLSELQQFQRKKRYQQQFSDIDSAYNEFSRLIKNKFSAEIVNQRLVCRDINIASVVLFSQDVVNLEDFQNLITSCKNVLNSTPASSLTELLNYAMNEKLDCRNIVAFNDSADFTNMSPQELQQHFLSTYQIYYPLNHIKDNQQVVLNYRELLLQQLNVNLQFANFFIARKPLDIAALVNLLGYEFSASFLFQSNVPVRLILKAPLIEKGEVNQPCELISGNNSHRTYHTNFVVQGTFFWLESMNSKSLRAEPYSDYKYVYSNNEIQLQWLDASGYGKNEVSCLVMLKSE
uniref:Uncharacterized protein n=1 Tax=Spironucleus salmonicida TaxID=348837 RepID=V6LFA2_9EUKA|eukprot:EST42376.1 Hypothetical protein SS50377_18062 [Spironucleus salmonicida]